MNKTDKEWARAKIFQIIDTPTAQLLAEDPRDKLVSRKKRMDHIRDASVYAQGPRAKENQTKREPFSHEQQQMQLFAKYLADELKKRGFDQK